MADLRNPKLIIAKGFLFLFCGLLASAILLIENPHWRVAVLLCVAVWGFARFYYFAFYVIEHYVDPRYRFAGLGAFVRYMMRVRRSARATRPAPSAPGDRPGEGQAASTGTSDPPPGSARH